MELIEKISHYSKRSEFLCLTFFFLSLSLPVSLSQTLLLFKECNAKNDGAATRCFASFFLEMVVVVVAF